MHKKTVVLTENFHSVFRSAAVFPSPRVPPIETTYLRPEYYMQKKSHITSRKLSRRAVF